MSDTLYQLRQPAGGGHVFEPVEDAIRPTDYDRRILAGALLQKLHDWHRAYTGPRNRVGAGLDHNTRDAAAGVFGTLLRFAPDLAERFKETHGTPSSWVRGPVVDCAGYLCAGIYHERVEPKTSPPAYTPPSVQLDGETEHEKLQRDAESALRRAALILGTGSLTAETECECGRTVRWQSDTGWLHLDGEESCRR